MSPEQAAIKLLELIPHAKKVRKAMFCDKQHTYTHMNGFASVTPMMESRQRGYHLGTLDEFRAAVSRITMQTYGEDDEPIDYGGVDCTQFGVEGVDGWRAWEPAEGEVFGTEPPF